MFKTIGGFIDYALAFLLTCLVVMAYVVGMLIYRIGVVICIKWRRVLEILAAPVSMLGALCVVTWLEDRE